MADKPNPALILLKKVPSKYEERGQKEPVACPSFKDAISTRFMPVFVSLNDLEKLLTSQTKSVHGS